MKKAKKSKSPKNQKSLKKLDTLKQAVYRLRRNFKSSMPWMFLFFVFKENYKAYLFHYLVSFPAIQFKIRENDSLVLDLQWQGTNADEFIYGAKQSEDEIGKVIGEEQKQKKAWAKLGLHVDKLAKAECYSRNQYSAASSIVARKINRIDIYDWGFEIGTRTPVDIVGAKSKALKGLLGVNYMNEIEQFLSDIIGSEFQLPHKTADPKTLRYFWNGENLSGISDDEMERILAPDKSSKAADTLDIGQKTGRNILLE